MKHTAACLALALSLCSTCLWAADPVKDCPKGLVCYTVAEDFARTDKLLQRKLEIVDLQEKLSVAKAKQLRKVGHNLGCGGGLAVTSASEGGVWEPGLFCGYMFGYRW